VSQVKVKRGRRTTTRTFAVLMVFVHTLFHSYPSVTIFTSSLQRLMLHVCFLLHPSSLPAKSTTLTWAPAQTLWRWQLLAKLR
jgi:hypothetical protein